MRSLCVVLLSIFPIFCAGCDEEVDCEDNPCDPASEFCVYFGSDTDEPGTADCYDLPASCSGAPDCVCLEGEDVGGFGLPWCLEEGGCELIDGVVSVTCPGG